MKKLLTPASCLLLPLLAVALLRTTPPAQGAPPQGAAQTAPAQGLEARVAALETELKAEKDRHAETRALLEQTLAYLDRQAKASQALVGALDECEKQGFAVGENWRSRQTLLAGMRARLGEAQTGLPKAPAVPAPAPAATPMRAARK